jgi:hypothetical protein
MNSINLIELAEEISYDEMAELLARFILNEEQSFAEQMISSSDDTTKMIYRKVLSNSSQLCLEAEDLLRDVYLKNFLETVKITIGSVAEEYVRDV